MMHRRHQRCLAIRPALPLDPRPICGARGATVTPHHQPRPQNSARSQRDLPHLLRHDRLARQQRYGGLCRHRRQKPCVQMAVFDHVAHRAVFNLCRVKVQRKGRSAFARAPIAGHNLQDGLRCHRPNPDRRQQPLRGKGQRIGPPVKPHLGPRLGLAGIHHRHAQSSLCQGQRQSGPVQPTAHDHNICLVCMFHAPIIAQSGGKVHHTHPPFHHHI